MLLALDDKTDRLLTGAGFRPQLSQVEYRTSMTKSLHEKELYSACSEMDRSFPLTPSFVVLLDYSL